MIKSERFRIESAVEKYGCMGTPSGPCFQHCRQGTKAKRLTLVT